MTQRPSFLKDLVEADRPNEAGSEKVLGKSLLHGRNKSEGKSLRVRLPGCRPIGLNLATDQSQSGSEAGFARKLNQSEHSVDLSQRIDMIRRRNLLAARREQSLHGGAMTPG